MLEPTSRNNKGQFSRTSVLAFDQDTAVMQESKLFHERLHMLGSSCVCSKADNQFEVTVCVFTWFSGFKVTRGEKTSIDGGGESKGCDLTPSLTAEFAATDGVGRESDVLDAEGVHVRVRHD
jgi:hypothetical protein